MTLEEISRTPMAVVRACVGKQRFDCPQDAHKAVQSHRRRRRPDTMNAYRCRHCGGWHIGNRYG